MTTKLVICLCLFAMASASFLDQFKGLGQKYKDIISRPYFPWKMGKCLEMKQIEDFDVAQFFDGKWYEQRSFGNFIFQGVGECSSMDTKYNNETGDIAILNYHFEPELSKWVYVRGYSTAAEVKASSFPIHYDMLAGITSVSIPFTVVGTDYDNYAVLYSCQHVFGFKAEMSWIVTRARGSSEFDAEIEEVLKTSGLQYGDYFVQQYIGCGSDEPKL